MKRRYKIHLHESGERDGSVAEGTLVLHLGGGEAIQACSIEEAENAVRKNVHDGKLGRGRVYQICPPPDSSESLRALAVAMNGESRGCYLDHGHGLYAEFKRIRLSEPMELGAH
jgi:hypothetical protein